ncbi:MAG: M1 family metallopeptidase [Bacteroidota bacterium]
MKRIIILLLFILDFLNAFSQGSTVPVDYFQQEVNYNIDITLDDANHQLVGIADVEYINNSPDTLGSIYFHLWANAYQSHQSAYAKQQIKNGNTRFFFAKNSEMGGYETIDFKTGNESLTWAYDEKHKDIVLVQLGEPLLSGQSVSLRITFVINIPRYFSRMGREGDAYYITQWYPKPAVYDSKGWHPMPYLDMGEFYSEFGKYDVKITLPENYYVAATGELKTKSEIAFLEKRVRETSKFIAKQYPRGSDVNAPLEMKDTFPKSASKLKEIRYIADNVHDFAWFADKRFFIQKSRVAVGPNQNVDTWAFFNIKELHLWKEATNYINRGVEFYSQKVGPYPYPHATAVSNPFADAGAMEYPMVTLVDQMEYAQALDVVIAHEIGHNWFYGILGFNERDYPWLDEGLNTHYERLYEKSFYPKTEENIFPKIIQRKGQLGINELVNVSMLRANAHQAISTPIGQMTEVNYGLGVYDRAADAFIGRLPALKMKRFFQEWKFKHPQPEDFMRHFDLEKDTAFQEMLNTTKKNDYKAISVLKSDSYELKISNTNGLAYPFELTMRAGEKVRTKVFEGFTGTKILKIPIEKNFEIDEFLIDEKRAIPDINRSNNNIRTSGIFPKSDPLRLRFLGGAENPKYRTLYWMPAVGWNNYDKTMLGVVLHNNDFATRKLEYTLVPMYGTASQLFVGSGILKYNFFPTSSLFRRVTLGIGGRRFAQDYDWDNKYYNYYSKIAPQLEFVFRKKNPNSTVQHKLFLRNVSILLNNGFVSMDNPDVVTRMKTNYYVNELKYTYENTNVTGPLQVSFTAHQGEGFVRLFANAKKFIPYKERGKGMTLKAFAGVLPYFDNPAARVNFQLGGFNSRFGTRDYMYDELLLGRTEGRGNSLDQGTDGIFSQQIFNRDAGFKTLSDFASSSEWMASFGMTTSMPGALPLRPYADAAIYNRRDETRLAYSIGISIVPIPDAFEIYIPFFENDEITAGTAYDVRDTIWKRITFLLDLNNLRKKGRGNIRFY